MRTLLQCTLLVIFCIGFGLESLSQQDPTIDSLLIVLNIAHADSNKTIAHLALSRRYNKLKEVEKARTHAEEAIALAERSGYKKGVARGYNMLGVVSEKMKNDEEALKNYGIALEMCQKEQDKVGMAMAHFNIGNVHVRHLNYTEAIENLKVCATLNEELGPQGDKPEKANAVRQIGISYGQLGDYSKALVNFHTYLKIALEMGDSVRITNAYGDIGGMHYYQGRYAEAEEAFSIALERYKRTGDRKSAAEILSNIGTVQNGQSKYAEAIQSYIACRTILLEIAESEGLASVYHGIAESYNGIGGIHQVQGNYAKALDAYHEGLKLNEKFGYKQGIAAIHGNIGGLYVIQNQFDKGLEHLYQTLEISTELGNKRYMGYAYNHIASAYEDQGNVEKALSYWEKALNIAKELGDRYGEASALSNIGNAYLGIGNYSTALSEALKALPIMQELNDLEAVAPLHTMIGIIYRDLGNYDEARKHLDEGLALSQSINAKLNIMEAYRELTTLDSLAENWEAAYRNHNLYLTYRDSLYNEENTKKLVEAQLQYEFGKKEDSLQYQQALTQEQMKHQTLLARQHQQSFLLKDQELKLALTEKDLQQLAMSKSESDLLAQRAETRRKQDEVDLLNKEAAIQDLNLRKQKQAKLYLVAGTGLFVLLTFFIYYSYLTRQKLKLQTLRNKIASDLHDDVGSTLSSIAIFTDMAKQQSKEAIPMLDTISDSSKKMLDAMADIVWAINPENDQFEKILLRMRNFAFDLLGSRNIEFKFVADDHVSAMKLPMDVRKNLYLIFKEATNNMVKYSGADKAHFSIKEEKDVLTMEIRDNGKGFDMESRSTGNGLKNMQRRAEEMKGKLRIVSRRNEGTSIAISVAV